MDKVHQLAEYLVANLALIRDEPDDAVRNDAIHTVVFFVAMEIYKEFGRIVLPGKFIKGPNNPMYVDEFGEVVSFV